MGARHLGLKAVVKPVCVGEKYGNNSEEWASEDREEDDRLLSQLTTTKCNKMVGK